MEKQTNGREALSFLVRQAAKDQEAGRIETAIDGYYTALDMAQRLDNRRIQGTCLLGLAIIARCQRNFEMAEEFCLEGLAIGDSAIKTPSQALLCFQLGMIYVETHDFATAKIWHEKSISI